MESPMPESLESVDEVTEEELGPFRVTAVIREFSNENINDPSNQGLGFTNIDYSEVDELFAESFNFEVYANGWDDESAGYVCIRLGGLFGVDSFEGSYLVSVIDGKGEQRFSRSFTFSVSKSLRPFLPVDICIKYFPRETLLRDPVDLLPNDTLTLQTDVYIEKCIKKFPPIQDPMEELVLQCFQTDPVILPGGHGHETHRAYYLLLDNEFVKLLSQESEYFERILDIPMMEKKSRRMRLDVNECTTFQNIAKIVIGMTPLEYYSGTDILDMCIVADKYDIPSVMQTCLRFLKLILLHQDADEILKFSPAYVFGESIYDLSDVIQSAIKDAHRTTEDGSGQHTGESEWVYTRYGDETVMYFENRKRRVLQVDEEERMMSYEEESVFHFYK